MSDFEAIEKSERLIQWFADKDKSQIIQLNECTKIIDLNKFIDCQSERLKKLKPRSRIWILSYYQLYKLKLKMQKP